MWAAYSKGVDFPDMERGLSASDFGEKFSEMILEHYDACWTLVSGKPVGLALGFWPHAKARNMILDRLVWFPWATPRNRLEAAVKFFVNIRHEIPMMGFAKAEDGPFFIALLRHGMLRRVGTSHTILEDGPAQVYETRSEH